MAAIAFEASACGKYVVAKIGEKLRVLTVDEAVALVAIYREAETKLRRAAQPNAAEYDATLADALQVAVSRCRDIEIEEEARVAERRRLFEKR